MKARKRKTINIVSLYEKWAKKNNIKSFFIPFCKQDTWAGHLVASFAEFIIAELPTTKKEGRDGKSNTTRY